MGGYGSGGHNSTGRRTTAGMLALSVSVVKRDGLLRPGAGGTITWSRDGEPFATVGIRTANDTLTLTYTASGTDCTDHVNVTWHDCHFGGQRPYFRCPGCYARAGILYGPRFRCRRCHNLAYPSQRQSAYDRAIIKAGRIRESMGGHAGMAYPFPDRPRYMHRRTYERLKDEAYRCELIADDHLIHLYQRLTRNDPKGFWT